MDCAFKPGTLVANATLDPQPGGYPSTQRIPLPLTIAVDQNGPVCDDPKTHGCAATAKLLSLTYALTLVDVAGNRQSLPPIPINPNNGQC